MSEEEIKNNSVMKCCICNNYKIGQFIVIEDKKYHLNCITELQQENSQLKEEIKELELHVGLRQKRNLISKFDKEYDLEDKKKNPNRTYACIMPDAEEVYKRYYDYKNRNEKAIKITYKILMNNVDNRMICKEEEQEYFDWLDSEMLKQEKILKGDKE